jgi:branched-chain amino acid aminotransferase
MFVFINHRYVSAEKAVIPVSDRGFRFGDGVFETIRVHQGRMYQWSLHLNRLEGGMQALKMPAPDGETLHQAACELLIKNEIESGFVRLAISRGSGSRGYLPTVETSPTIVIETIDGYREMPDSISLWLSSYAKVSRHALPVKYKLAQGLNATLAQLEAQEKGAREALLLNDQGYVSEAGAANIFWVKDQQVYTPALSCDCVDGTIRQAVIRLAPTKVQQVEAALLRLLDADEVFITNTGGLIMPVTSLHPNEKFWPVGAITQQLQSVLLGDVGN